VDTGEPGGPNKMKFVHHCGYLVRDRLPISTREWKKKTNAPHISFVSDRDKTLIWKDVLVHFTLQIDGYDDIIDGDELKERVRDWAMKKMATQFQTWKKHLYTTYVKKNIAPDFTVPGPISKQRPYWDEFVQYKTSEEGVSRVIKNQRNAQQKTYHHNLGSGGYPTAIKKWNKMEADLLAKGITPESLKLGERAKNWFFAHGGTLDQETRKCVYGARLQEAAERLFYAQRATASGAFRPNREKDELTYAIGTIEHGGRTRGKGSVSWEHGFPQDRPSYRSRQRKKEEEAQRLQRLEEAVRKAQERKKNLEARMHEEIRRQVQIAVSASKQASEPGINISQSVQLKSSCTSTEIPNQGDTGLRFPVDDVTEPCTTCELHIPKENSTIKVAIDLVNPIDRTKTPRIHGNIIQEGYATISVDKAEKGFSDLPLDIPGGDGEKTLGEAEKTFILWRKRYIIILGMSAPPPPELPHHRYVRMKTLHH